MKSIEGEAPVEGHCGSCDGELAFMADELGFLQDLLLLSRAAQVVLQEKVLESISEPALTKSRNNLLRLMVRRGRQSVNDIALFLGQTKAAASQNVDALVKTGLVSRKQDSHDRRCVWVSITAKGRRLLSKAQARQQETIARVMARFPDLKDGRIATAMRRLAFALLENSCVESRDCLQCCAYESASCLRHGDEWQCRYMHEAKSGKRS